MQNKYILIPFIIIGFFYFPIITNNQLYVDDIFRAQTGYDGWAAAGRPLTDFILHFMMMTKGHLMSFGQLGQILSVVAMAITAIYFCKNVFQDESAISYCASCGFAISPYFLENFSYQYDGLPMTLSLCASMVAAIHAFKDGWKNLLISSISITIACSLYQTSINSFIGFACSLAILHSLLHGISFRSMIKFLSKSVVSLILGAVFYAMIVKFLMPMSDSRGQGFSLDFSLLNFFWIRIQRFYTTSFNSLSAVYCIVSSLLFLAVVYIKRKNNITSNSSTLLIFACLLVILVCPIGMLVIFKESSITPRMMMGASALSCLFLAMVYFLRLNTKSNCFILFLFFIPYIVISFSFGASIKEQRLYDHSVVHMSLNDIRSNGLYDKDSYIVYAGRLPVAPLAKNTVNNLPIIALMLVPAYDWTASMIAQSYDVRDVRFDFARKEQKEISSEVCSKNETPLTETNAYAIYSNSATNGFLVWMKGGKKTPC
ncbi:glucosyltransferase domain-containing protein [Enterobacter sp.]|uniref:glucosyltransferase domain-containing protein n=1 Tax=Enterobacter sp. TaxID=42895 RepID=UPI002980E7B5|nr:glucosyltransferase domain-containing protein [Enterobacter sp.]